MVKQSLGRFAASNLHPKVACELLKVGATRAVCNMRAMQPPQFEKSVALDITFLVADMAEMALWVHGLERVARL